MSIETEFESTITNVKNAYQGLDNLGATIPQNKTIENIKSCLDEIYNNLPKTSYAEGTEITLSNTLKGKLDFENDIVGYGQTSQEGTPTPDSPQEIEVVRGKNRLPLNEADFTTTFYGQNVEIKDQTIKISGSATQIYSIIIGKNGLVLPSDTSRITFKVNSGTYKYTQFNSGTSYSGINVRLKDEDTNIMYTTGSTITLTETHKFSINIFVADTGSKNAEIKIQLEKGSQATSYLPYNTLEVKASNKNLLNITATTQTISGISMTINEDKSITLNGTAPSGGVEIPIGNCGTLKSGTYTGNCETNSTTTSYYIRLGEGEEQGSTWITNITHNSTFNLSTDKSAYARLIIRANVVLNNITIYPQVEPGSTATTYEPYITPITKQLSLGEYEFAKIGNYVDTIEYDIDNDNVYKNENVGKYQFTGNETIEQFTSRTNTVSCSIPNILQNLVAKTWNYEAYCNYLIAQNCYTEDKQGFFTHYSGTGVTRVYLGIDKSIADTSEKIKTWLGNTKPILYYQQTLIKEPITGTLKDQIKALYNSQSLNGTTIIEIDGQLPLIIKVRALKSN